MGSFAETYNDPAFVAIESRKVAVEHINADDVIVFFPYILNEIKGKRSYAIFRWFNRFFRFSSYFEVDQCRGFGSVTKT